MQGLKLNHVSKRGPGWKQLFRSQIIQQRLAGSINSFSLGQNDHHFADDSFKRIFMNEKFFISILIPMKFAPKAPIDNKVAFFIHENTFENVGCNRAAICLGLPALISHSSLKGI